MTRAFVLAFVFVVSAGTARSQPSADYSDGAAPLKPAAGPITRAIARDAGRMAAAPRPSTSSDSRQPSAASDWSRVARLRPGAMIHLTTTGSPQVRRHVVRADDVTLTVLDVAHPALTDGVGKRLLEIAVEHPSALMQARQIAMFVWGDLRIGPDGLFVAGRKILNLDEILVTVPRSDVLQVSRPERRGSRWGALAGGIAGAIIGTRLGVLSLQRVQRRVCRRESSDAGVVRRAADRCQRARVPRQHSHRRRHRLPRVAAARP